MKYLAILLILNSQFAYSQTDAYKNDLIKLAKIYKSYHVIEPENSIYNQLDSIEIEELIGAKIFITELIKEKNSIADDKFITKPDSSTLKNLYLIRGLTWNMFNSQFGGTEKENFGLDSLMAEETNYHEQFANYYSMLYTSILNKNRPLDMSTINFDLDKYNFDSDDEKGIFFLESMETLGTLISGYFYIDPPNCDKAMSIIENYPKFDNQAYYKFKNVDFEDFKYTYSSKDPKESYKKYQINKLVNTILSHAMCLSQDAKTIDKMQDIIGNSILINRDYWKYYEAPEILEQIYGK